jgi:hypothetical protein
VSSREEPEPYVHADVDVGEVLLPCSCDVVVVEERLNPVEVQLSGLSDPC